MTGGNLCDHEGNHIFECPNCKLEYTVPADRLDFTYHCEVERCRYAVLRAKFYDIRQENPVVGTPIKAIYKGGVC